ncbi:MAG: terpene cyclase/mutase family protein [Planctomycetes bacterium]|nr:terpene cyclase/mutase family protein [Planctomycetota bacterium]
MQTSAHEALDRGEYDGVREAHQKAKALRAEVDALGKSINRLVPAVLEELLRDLKSDALEARNQAILGLAEVGSPAMTALEVLVKSGTPEERERAKKAIQLVRKAEAMQTGVQELLKLQEDTGRWSYEAYHQDPGEPGGLPYGFQVGGTSIVGTALLLVAPDDKDVQAAVRRGLGFVFEALGHEKMTPRTQNAYDVRIWGHCFALEFLCHVRAHKMAREHANKVDEWITLLIKTIAEEESPGGGWNYASRGTPASFVTAPMIQSLLLARSQGEEVPEELFDRGRKVLENARMKDGAFVYAGKGNRNAVAKRGPGSLPGSASRSLVCETTLALLGGSSPEAIQFALDNFYKYWDDLDVRRGKAGTHVGPYAIASYYFYYAHRYCAQVIEMLPEEKRALERDRLAETILKTRSEDGTWNDRYAKLHKRSRNVGTAFVLLALLAEKTPLPPKLSDIKGKGRERREF